MAGTSNVEGANVQGRGGNVQGRGGNVPAHSDQGSTNPRKQILRARAVPALAQDDSGAAAKRVRKEEERGRADVTLMAAPGTRPWPPAAATPPRRGGGRPDRSRRASGRACPAAARGLRPDGPRPRSRRRSGARSARHRPGTQTPRARVAAERTPRV